ncbi:odorant receptor 98a-like [Zophobas morio]|uniref:odorant receptor 98a-like n=1 Tax=Zophobas morio TaxID=2755281 RepID=UPI00308368CF
MSAKSKNYLSFPIGFIEGSGLSSTSKLYRKILSLGVFLPMTFVLLYLIIRKFREEKRDVLMIAEVFEAITTCAHLLQRKYVMFMHRKLIKEVNKDRDENFWKYDLISTEMGLSFERQMIILFDRSKVVPLMCWTPEDNKLLTAVIYIMQVLIMLEIMWALLSLDSFYLLMCTDLRIQFLLLQKTIQSVKLGEGSDTKGLVKIIDCTKHHKFLLRIHGKINTIFSSYFIMLYLVTVACASMHSYIILFKSPSLGDSIKSVCYLSGMLFQVGLYFVITSNIEIEAENLCEEIYNINWEGTTNLKIRKHILFMLMKAQEPVSITGGGMLHVNRNEYVGLVRLAYSIATILGGMT